MRKRRCSDKAVSTVSFTIYPDGKRHEKPPGCAAGMDGDCDWKHCPQLHDNEPEASGRSCPLMHYTDDPEW